MAVAGRSRPAARFERVGGVNGLCSELDGFADLDALFSSSSPLFSTCCAAMVFSFSFNLSVPGITNPFTAAAAASSEPEAPVPKLHFDADGDLNGVQLPSSIPRRRPPSPSFLPPLSKKRGWVPSSPEPSRPAPIHTSTSGYLDTPAKYRDMAHENADQDEIEEMVGGECRLSFVSIPHPLRFERCCDLFGCGYFTSYRACNERRSSRHPR
ncbi:hypothetical protein L226DRAFT_382428 [Lentinus tigrinus ALCF2SS1-7]|uniref:uncharacterized protein n=1 Tax=Lentinus tigrinus ALCF2SS1-7 TaxID=1328758 RepID=UPI0011662C5D|nr:hypothetical protein L226DRAFT_382428 [Lentinus tigrinus ALCF2SS1-7]